ncbi:hypothetical protein [Homoserinimonas hongtaonis]|nr:hypothetical protein [Salinibacterium hongtaonis]
MGRKSIGASIAERPATETLQESVQTAAFSAALAAQKSWHPIIRSRQAL